MPSKTSRFTPRLILIAGGVLLIILVIHLASVVMLRYFVERELHPALPRGTYIGDAHLNLFTGALRIVDFELRDRGQLRMRFGELDLQLSPWRLLLGTVRVEKAMLRRAYVRVDRREDGSFDLGLPDFGGAAESPPQGAEPPDVTLDGAHIERLIIEYHDGDLDSVVSADSVKVGTYSLRAESQQIPVQWQLHWDHRPLSGDAVVTLAADGIAAEGNVTTGPLDLGRAERLARLPSSVKGEAALQGQFAWSAPRFSLSGDLQVPHLGYTIAERSIVLTDVEFPGFALELLTAPDILVEFVPGPGSRAATWQTELEGQQVDGRAFSLSGRLRYEGRGVIDTDDLVLEAESLDWNDAGRALKIAGLRIAGQVQQSLTGETPFPALHASLSARTVEYTDQPATIAVRLNDLGFDQLALSQLGEAETRQLGGRLTIGASEVTQADTALSWSSVDVLLGGEVGRDLLRLMTDAAVSDLEVNAPQLAHGPLTLGRAAASGLELGRETRLRALDLAQLALPGEPGETSLNVASIQIGPSQYSSDQGLSLGQILIDGLQTAVIRDEGGQWRYPMSQPTQRVAGDSEETGQGEEPEALPWRVAGVQIGGDSHLKTADAMNPDMIAPRFQIERFDVGAIDSNKPLSDTPFDLVLRVDEYSEFVVNGDVRPLAPELFLNAKGHLHGFAMQAFNGLVANDLGHRFVTGQLDNDFEISIAKQRLEMANQLGLADVEVEPLPDKEGPPLGTAIALLEDRDGNIKLDVPVSGDLSDPGFRVLGALNPIITKAVAGTAALAIQPLGSVLLVGSLLADQALKVTFEPALFEPGSVDLDSATSDYLGQLGAKLNEKPKLTVRVCGLVAEVERRKDKQGAYLDTEAELLGLAQQRSEVVRAALRRSGAGAKQLRACRPAIDPDPVARPRVDIRF